MVYSLFVLSVLLLCAGLWLVLSRSNAILVLIGVELILNAALLNFVAFNALRPVRLDGQITALFGIVLAAAEAAVALAIILRLYQRYRSVDLDRADTLQG
jgi:NADH:ubiquinone oxidoreductase subunit K